MPSLEIHAPSGRQTKIELDRAPIKLGRAETCDVILYDDAEVSRVHAEVWIEDDGRVMVLDRGSKNGTRTDDGEVFRNAKRPAYKSIRIGEHDIRVIGAAPRTGTTSVTFIEDPPDKVRMGDTQFFPSSRRLDLNQQRLNLLIQLSQRIGGVFDRKQLLEQALDACCEALHFERGLIALKTQRGDTESPITRNVQTDETGAYKISRSLINRALVHGERAIVNNPATDLPNLLTESLVRFPICSALVVPILNRNEILGVIYGDRISQGQVTPYQPADVDFLAAIAQQVGVGVVNLRLLQEHLRAQKMYAELEQARSIQQRLLPEEPLVAGCVALEGYNEPSSAVSGDYFDYFDLEDGRIGIIIADVTGHGLPAALVMANLQSAVRVALSADVALTDLVDRVNKLVCRNVASHVFITAILGTIDTRTGLLEYVSAGHPGPLLFTERGVVPREHENALPLGVEPDETYTVYRIQPDEGVRAVLFYTDGLVEAIDGGGNLLGIDGVVRGLSTLRDLSTGSIIRIARSTMRDFLSGVTRIDDMTLLAIHYQ